MRRGEFNPFFQEPCFSVQNSISHDRHIKPRIKITASEELIIALTLAKEGYFNGNPNIILNSPADLVLQTYQYEMFRRVYEDTYTELNKGK